MDSLTSHKSSTSTQNHAEPPHIHALTDIDESEKSQNPSKTTAEIRTFGHKNRVKCVSSPELLRVIEAWDTLPADVQAKILALI